MWEISNSWQVLSFLISLLFGVGFGVYYSLFKAIRRSFYHTAWAVFLEDIIFFFTAAVLTFLLMLVLSCGEIRFFILLGIFLGFCIFYFTLAERLSLVFAILIKAVYRVVKAIFAFFGRVLRFIGATATKIGRFCKEKSKKCYKYLKKPLKEQGEIVYTKKNKQKV